MKPRIRVCADGDAYITYFDPDNIPDDWLTAILILWVEHIKSNKAS